MIVRRILAPIDGSEHADRALDYALELAEQLGAEVEILTVVPETVETPEWMREYTLKMKEEGERMISKAAEGARGAHPNVTVTKELEEGYAAEKILETVKRRNFDLIIMGNRGLGLVRGLLLGSVSSRIVNQAEIPVLIVK